MKQVLRAILMPQVLLNLKELNLRKLILQLVLTPLIEMFGATLEVLRKMINDGPSRDMRGEAKSAYREMKSFEFVFILLLLHRVLGISDILCRALQAKSLDILNALNYITSTKRLLQEFRDNGWDDFVRSVESFCGKHDISVADMSVRYMEEINSRFPEQTMELLTLSSALDPIDGFKLFDIDRICCLAEKFYPHDFTANEIFALRRELEHYKFDVLSHPLFQQVASLSELCRRLIETKKSQHYFLIDRLIRLVLTLPVSTATTERAFSAMSLIKTSLRNKMENEFLSNCMVVYVEREIADTIVPESIIDEFYYLKPRL